MNKKTTPFIAHDDGTGDTLYVRASWIPHAHRLCMMHDGIAIAVWQDEIGYRITDLIVWYEKEAADLRYPDIHVLILGKLKIAEKSFRDGDTE